MKEFDASTLAQIGAPFKRVACLAQVGVQRPNGATYIEAASTPIEISYNGLSWQPLDLNVDSFMQSVGGIAVARITFPPYPHPMAELVNDGLLKGQLIYLYRAFVTTQGHPIGTPDLFLVGRYNSGTVTERATLIEVIEGSRNKHGRAPRQRVVPPIFNHAPKANTVIKFQNTTITMRPEGNV